MSIGPAVRRSLGRFETPAAEAYRRLFFSVDHFASLTRVVAPNAKTVLEIGCGDGSVADRIIGIYPDATYVGIDIAPEPGRRFTGDRRRASFRSMLSSQLRATDPEPFDLVLVVDVLHHVPADSERAELLADAAAMTGSGGTVLVKEWERKYSLSYAAGWASDRYISGDRQVRYMDRDELRAIIAQGASQLEPVGVTTVRPWPCTVVHVLRAN